MRMIPMRQLLSELISVEKRCLEVAKCHDTRKMRVLARRYRARIQALEELKAFVSSEAVFPDEIGAERTLCGSVDRIHKDRGWVKDYHFV